MFGLLTDDSTVSSLLTETTAMFFPPTFDLNDDILSGSSVVNVSVDGQKVCGRSSILTPLRLPLFTVVSLVLGSVGYRPSTITVLVPSSCKLLVLSTSSNRTGVFHLTTRRTHLTVSTSSRVYNSLTVPSSCNHTPPKIGPPTVTITTVTVILTDLCLFLFDVSPGRLKVVPTFLGRCP